MSRINSTSSTVKRTLIQQVASYANDTCERSQESNLLAIRIVQRTARALADSNFLTYDDWFDVDAICDAEADKIAYEIDPPSSETEFGDR